MKKIVISNSMKEKISAVHNRVIDALTWMWIGVILYSIVLHFTK